MKSFAVVSVLASVAFAQTTSSLIPTGISSTCGSFLSTLNNDSSLASCTTPLISATSAILSGNTTSTSGVSSTLNNVCGSAVQCDEVAIRKQLTSFYQSCTSDMGTNSDVLAMYDALYAIVPLKKAICSKDDSGAYCATASTSSGTSLTSLYSKVTAAAQSVFKLNVSTLKSTNIAFLFLKATTDSAKLCTSCTRSIFTSYASWETSIPYGPGIANSPLLGGQSDLYNGMKSTCGDSFLTGAVQAAGSLSDGLISNGAAPQAHMGGLAAIVGAASVVAAFAL
ncbi:hypothetical protein QCA50_008264 [Cerrena zonata]|uniref:Uncharacterized protein n=1 Tax=Cerrena zonata TaxID=2478898 RepID=A0AAW0G5I8_9APHY